MIVRVIGNYGVGKTTLCKLLSRHFGGVAPAVRDWPSYNHFQKNPKKFAFQNQHEAIESIASLQNYPSIHKKNLFLDSSISAAIYIHSFDMLKQGLISIDQYSSLKKYAEKTNSFNKKNEIVFLLQANESSLRQRIIRRNRLDLNKHLAEIVRHQFLWSSYARKSRNRNLYILDGNKSKIENFYSACNILERKNF